MLRLQDPKVVGGDQKSLPICLFSLYVIQVNVNPQGVGTVFRQKSQFMIGMQVYQTVSLILTIKNRYDYYINHRVRCGQTFLIKTSLSISGTSCTIQPFIFSLIQNTAKRKKFCFSECNQECSQSQREREIYRRHSQLISFYKINLIIVFEGNS